ncbi:hypothetical protein LSAT2_033183, partial [Lamellibrachia satsuma]
VSAAQGPGSPVRQNNMDSRTSVTETLYNTTPASVNTGKDGSTAHENESNHPSTDIAKATTPSTATRVGYGHNNTTR